MISLEACDNIIYSVAKGKLTKEDYNQMLPFLQEKVKTFGKLRWYFEMQDFKGWDLDAAWKDLRFDVENNENIEQIAMVGDKNWEKQLTQLMKPFAKADVKYFPVAERETAKTWLSKTHEA